MNKSRWFHATKYSKGQSIVIIAVALVVMVAMAALILDGGQLYMNRRAAQAAADAAAIAGANEMCKTKSEAAGILMAENYAMTENGMTAATAWIEPNDELSTNQTVSELFVEVTMSADSFFAGIFGVEENTVKATAAAVCGPLAGKGVLPIAWYCQPPWDDENEFVTYNNGYCEYSALDWYTQLTPLLNKSASTITDLPNYEGIVYTTPISFTGASGTLLDEHIYIVMDTEKTCADGYDCDINDDGRNDILSGGERGWLSLDGESANANTLISWIKYGYSGIIQPH